MKKLSIILLALVLILSGCGDSDTQESENGLPKKITIGTIRVANDKTVAEQLGFFKEFFEDKGIEVEVLFFDSGTAANVAFASGDIDFAGMGYTNAVVALSKHLDVELIWIHEVLGKNEALVVQKDSGIKSVADLKGKKVATPFSSTSHLSLVKALELEGLKVTDLSLIDMDTEDIMAAWQRGDIDATYTWEPTLSVIKETGDVIVTSEDLAAKGVKTVNIELANKKFTQKYPDLVADYISALAKAGKVYKDQPDTAVKAAADYLGIDQEKARTQMDGTIWLTREQEISDEYLGSEDKPGDFHRIFYETGEFLRKEDKIDRIPTMEEINEFINSSYIEKSLESFE